MTSAPAPKVKAPPKLKSPMRSRIVGHDRVKVGDLLANPFNWRLHTEAQQLFLAGLIDEVGFVRSLTVNLRTGHLVDGHARVVIILRSDPETLVDVEYIDVDEAEEMLILRSLDPISAMAGEDAAKLAEIAAMLRPQDERTIAMLEYMGSAEHLDDINRYDEDERADWESATPPPVEPSDGSLLSLVDVAIAEPEHKVETGEIWQLGKHLLICEDVLTGWPKWAPLLRGSMIFAPYSGPFVALSKKADETAVLMVQPNQYIAGHIIDRWAEVKGEDTIKRRKD